MSVDEEEVVLELLYRDDRPPSPLVDRLESLVADDVVDDYEVSAVDPDAHPVDRYTAWAATEGVSLRGCFATEPLVSPETGADFEVMTLPPVTLAEYRDDDLWFVAPCQDRQTVYTVLDRLNDLSAGQQRST